MDLAEGHWAATKKILKEKGAKGQQPLVFVLILIIMLMERL